MEYVELGSTSVRVSRIGFGCAAIGGYDYGAVDDRESVMAVRRALDLGVNLFDSADVYGFGHSEEILAKALGRDRAKVVVATKFGVSWDERGRTQRDLSPRRVFEALEGSLRRLKLDCIPLYQIHWPDARTRIADTLAALQRCQEKGRIKWIGCCNFSAKLLEEAFQYCRVESIQLPFSLIQPTLDGVTWDRVGEHRMTVLSYNSLGQGVLSGKYDAGSRFEGTDLRRRSKLFQGRRFAANLAVVERAREVAKSYGRTPTQVALRWVLDNLPGGIALVGVKRREQIEENCGSTGWNLSGGDLRILGTSNLYVPGPQTHEAGSLR